jgi:hypothetical protein
MFSTKKATVKLEGFTYAAGLTLIARLAASPSFRDLTFGIDEEATRVSIKGPRESVNQFMAVAKSLGN